MFAYVAKVFYCQCKQNIIQFARHYFLLHLLHVSIFFCNFVLAMQRHTYIIIYIYLAILLFSCNGGQTSWFDEQGDTLQLHYAKNITIVTFPDHIEVTMRNPWDTTNVLGKYVLYEELNSSRFKVQGSGFKVPLERAAVFSSVHCALLHELHADEAVGGSCDFEFFN